MGAARALLLGGAVGDHGAHPDEARARVGAGGFERPRDPLVVAAVRRLHLPAVALEAAGHVLAAEGQGGPAIDGDLVVVVEVDEAAQAVVAGEAGRLRRHPLHQVAVRDQGVDEVVLEGVPGAEPRREHGLAERHADAVGEALPQRAARDLDARGVPELGMARGPGVELAERLEVLDGEIEAGEVQERVEQHRAVAGREQEAVAPGPAGIPGVEAQVASPQDEGHVGRAHGQARVPAVRLLDGVGGEEADGVDALLRELGARVRHGRPPTSWSAEDRPGRPRDQGPAGGPDPRLPVI